MFVVCNSKNYHLAKRLNGQILLFNCIKFANGEIQVDWCGNVTTEANQDFVIVHSTMAPVNDSLIELLFAIKMVQLLKPKTIKVVAPYLGYGRQDMTFIVQLIKGLGVDKIITVDVHNCLFEHDYFINVLPNFYAHFNGSKDLLAIAPDQGAAKRANYFAKHAKCEVIVLNKTRGEGGVFYNAQNIDNIANRHCVIIDDIVDTGQTLLAAVDLLQQHNACHISACISHCLSDVKQLPLHLFDKFIITNSLDQYVNDKIKVLDISDSLIKLL